MIDLYNFKYYIVGLLSVLIGCIGISASISTLSENFKSGAIVIKILKKVASAHVIFSISFIFVGTLLICYGLQLI